MPRRSSWKAPGLKQYPFLRMRQSRSGPKGDGMNKLCKTVISFVAFAFVFSVLMAPSSSWAQAGGVEVSAAVHHDVSPPLWSIQSQAPRLQPREKPVHPLPLGPAGQQQPDTVLQSTPSFAVSTTA